MSAHLSKLWGIVGLGVWIMLIPLLGVPRNIINIIVVFSGLAVSILAFLLARSLAKNVPTRIATYESESN
jgi:hypothetical protein